MRPGYEKRLARLEKIAADRLVNNPSPEQMRAQEALMALLLALPRPAGLQVFENLGGVGPPTDPAQYSPLTLAALAAVDEHLDCGAPLELAAARLAELGTQIATLAREPNPRLI